MAGENITAAVVVKGREAERARWEKVDSTEAASERADAPDVCKARWQKVYAMFNATSDKAKDAAFLAVNLYFAKNGCSPAGGYTQDIVAAGTEVPASSVVAVTGRGDGAVRKWLRGALLDSVNALKYSKACEKDPVMVAEAGEYGLSPEQAWLMADWLAPKNPYLSAEEGDVAARVRVHKISRANVGRGGAQVGIKGESVGGEPVTGRMPEGQPAGVSSAYVGPSLY
jgi:hypothetical protein